MSLELLSSLVTVVWFFAFVALCVWSWSRRRHGVYTAAARMPLDESADGCAAQRAAEQDGSR